MARHKTAKRRASKPRGHRQSQQRRSTQNVISGRTRGELPYLREYAKAESMDEVARHVDRNDYSKLLNDASALARQNLAVTFGLGINAGLLTAQLARRWMTILRKS
jgi:hypothetical protein